MPILIAPPNVTAITTSTGHTFEPVDGVIDTGSAPGPAVDELKRVHRCTVATDAEISAIDARKIITEPGARAVAMSKAEILDALAAEFPEAVFDRRGSLGSLQKLLEGLRADRAAAEAAAAKLAADEQAAASQAEASQAA
jgi:hypothetical protein